MDVELETEFTSDNTGIQIDDNLGKVVGQGVALIIPDSHTGVGVDPGLRVGNTGDA